MQANPITPTPTFLAWAPPPDGEFENRKVLTDHVLQWNLERGFATVTKRSVRDHHGTFKVWLGCDCGGSRDA